VAQNQPFPKLYLQKIASLRESGFRNWDAFAKMSILNGKGYVLSSYRESCGVVVNLNTMTAVGGSYGMECQLKDAKMIVADDVNINIGGVWSGGDVPYMRSYTPLSGGGLNYTDEVTPEGAPEKAFFQKEKKRLFLAMGESGVGAWDTSDPSALWKLGQPLGSFYTENGYEIFHRAIDVVAENQYIFVLAGDDQRGVLAIVSPTEPDYELSWLSSASQVGELDINSLPVLLKKSGDRIFIATKNNILIIDVADATRLTLVETISVVATDIEVMGDVLIVASGNIMYAIQLDSIGYWRQCCRPIIY